MEPDGLKYATQPESVVRWEELPAEIRADFYSSRDYLWHYRRLVGTERWPEWKAKLERGPYRFGRIDARDPRMRLIDLVPMKLYPGGQDTVRRYEAFLREHPGQDLPPLCLFRDGPKLLVLNGRHRLEAYQRAGRRDLPAFVLEG